MATMLGTQTRWSSKKKIYLDASTRELLGGIELIKPLQNSLETLSVIAF